MTSRVLTFKFDDYLFTIGPRNNGRITLSEIEQQG